LRATGSAGACKVPQADAGADQSVDEGALVTLDGSASFDPFDDPLTHAWTQVAGTTVMLTGAATASPSFTAPEVPLGGETLIHGSLAP
jgi:hypothetical protein